MKSHKTILYAMALGLFGVLAGAAPAKAFCLINCEPKPEDAKKVFDNLVKKKFDKDAVIENFEITRFWPLDVEGAGHAGGMQWDGELRALAAAQRGFVSRSQSRRLGLEPPRGPR